MLYAAVTGILNAISSSILGLFVFLKNPRHSINRTFGIFCFFLAFWSYSYFFWQISSTEEMALFWSRLLMAGAIFIPITYLHFVFSFTSVIKKNITKIVLLGGYFISLLFFASNFTSLFVADVRPRLGFKFWPSAGILYMPFLIVWFFFAFYSIVLLLKAYRHSAGIKRSQLRYIAFGTIIGYLGGATNYFLWYDIPVPPVGNWTITLYVFLVAYAIAKYRLMDIRVAIGKTAVYIFSFATVVGFGLLLAFLNNLLANPFPYYIVFPFVAFFGALIFKPFLKLYEKLASRYFYYTFYSHQKVLGELGEELTSVLELGKLTSLITDTLIKTMKLDKTGVLLREPKTGDYRIQKIIGFKEENGISLVRDNFLTAYLQRTRKPVVYEELGLAIRDIKSKAEKEKLEDLRANMKRIEAKLCLPLFRENEIMGMIVLGRKLSGEPYSKQDIQLLTALSNQASIALENANLYAQVQDLSQNLQKKVDEQTEEIRRAYEVEKKARKELERLDKAKSQFML
ncbi:MAG: histidine kinase N-terminal 7TM domain-containing protein, partial [Candidatus Hodarchaeales archaeon]